jgi:LmbE family N-acetylglucosaminyl deacetylase
MTNELRLLAVLAHPDDESLGNGGMLAKYAAEGVKTHLVTATRGEQGWFADPDEYPGPEELGRIRETELRSAGAVLGLHDISFLDYHDGELADADHDEVVGKIVDHIRRIRPHVVVTFDQNGLYGHPDHIAICQFATAAVAAAADPEFAGPSNHDPHSVSKLYYMAWRNDEIANYEEAFGELVMDIDGEKRSSIPWPAWSITTRIDTSEYWERAWEAISHHKSQLPGYQKLIGLSDQTHKEMWGAHDYYRAFSRVATPKKEDDLFAGIRQSDRPSIANSTAILA